MNNQPNNPLHGKKLESILNELVEKIGWVEMGKCVKVRCFTHDPSIKSSLKFLRKTPWARTEVEQLYINTFHGFAWPEDK
ncbi:VF530 family protein [Thalassotalea atypica]|uniref:VF530 family protein n=1 Tax=Thalassotalea atypica TaxID=2054316 RepID=UPI002573664B|nr:VF530 family protein [Thalassotalea atypica]